MKKGYKQGDYEYYLFAAGYAATKTKANLLTIVAVLGLLPASKSCVSMIIYIRYHGCSRDHYLKLKDVLSGFLHAYGLVFTSYQKTYEVAGCIVKNGYVYGYMTNHPDGKKDLEEHITSIIKRNGLQATVGMYTELTDFTNRCRQLARSSSRLTYSTRPRAQGKPSQDRPSAMAIHSSMRA